MMGPLGHEATIMYDEKNDVSIKCLCSLRAT